jgi:hypothetical protein
MLGARPAPQPGAHRALQGGDVLRPAVDQVAEHDEVVARRRKGDFGEQPVECIAAALHVSDDIVHWVRSVLRYRRILLR